MEQTAREAAKEASPDALLRMMEETRRDDVGDRPLASVIPQLRTHISESVASRLEQFVAGGRDPKARSAVAVVLGSKPTTSGHRTLRGLPGDEDEDVSTHARMSLDRWRSA